MGQAGIKFSIRWLVNSLGLWLAAALLSSRISFSNSFVALLTAGLVLALLNMLIKPLLVILSLPALIFSLGLFMIVINGLLVWFASALYTPLHIANFGAAIFAGIVIGLVNWLVTATIEGK